MFIKFCFSGKSAFEIIHDAAVEAAQIEGYWSQHAEAFDDHAMLKTWSGKGQWHSELVGDDSIVEFDGYRNSFTNGTQFFGLYQFPWDQLISVHCESSTPEVPIIIELSRSVSHTEWDGEKAGTHLEIRTMLEIIPSLQAVWDSI